MTACRDIHALDQMDAQLLEKDDWGWLGNQRTKPFGLHLRATKDYIHKDRCPRHEDPRLYFFELSIFSTKIFQSSKLNF